MPARAIRSLPFRRSCPGSPDVEILGSPTSSHELNSWSLVRCRTGAVRSRSGVAYLQPVPSDHVVEDRYRGGLVRSRSPRPSCRGRQSRVDDGVIARGCDAARRRHHGDLRPQAGQAARSAARRQPAARSSSCRLVRSTSDRFVLPVVAGARLEERFNPLARAHCRGGRTRAGESSSLERRAPMRSTRWRVLRPSRADVTCSSIST